MLQRGPSFIIDRFAKSLEVTLTVTTSLFSFIFLLPYQEGWQGEWIVGDIITTLYMIATPGRLFKMLQESLVIM